VFFKKINVNVQKNTMNAKNFKMKMNICTHETPAFKNTIAHQMILSENFIVNKKTFSSKMGPKFYILFTSMLPFKKYFAHMNYEHNDLSLSWLNRGIVSTQNNAKLISTSVL
jgi:hypothetical protein